MEVTLKVNKQSITVDTDKVHESWLDHCLQYGIRRFINDKFAGNEGQTKFELCMGLAKEMNEGTEMPAVVRGSGGGSSADPVLTLARKNAKNALTLVFKAVTGATKAIDFAQHEKVAPFFKVTDDRAVWNDESVDKWIAKQLETGKADYMADAKATMEIAESAVEDELDF